MKKQMLTSVFVLITAALFGQSKWNLAVQYAFIGNGSYWTGGMSQANGRFNGSVHGGPGLYFAARYTANDHWSLRTGLGAAALGFDYSISSDYSLPDPKQRYVTNTLGFGTLEIPATVIYSFKPNCRNWRWFVGGGAKLVSHGGNMNAEKLVLFDDVPGSNYYLGQEMHVNSFTTGSGHLLFGIEKLMKKGGMWSVALMGNKGAGYVMATSVVRYNADGQQYEHMFTNTGDYCALIFTYDFRCLKSRNAQ